MKGPSPEPSRITAWVSGSECLAIVWPSGVASPIPYFCKERRSTGWDPAMQGVFELCLTITLDGKAMCHVKGQLCMVSLEM